ncbi:MAG: hypothetical protein M3044_00850 [Thermoproteota archaeon]|nr:hypothetical protein [Thermoproteota archaeon]
MNKVSLLVLVIGMTTLSSISLESVLFKSDNSAHAMGSPPSVCINRYDATITSMKINDGLQISDPVAHPNTNLAPITGRGYTVTLTLHSASKSSLGNTNVGSVWYDNSAFGFFKGTCVYGATPNKDITITYSVPKLMAGAPPGFPLGGQVVECESWPLTGPAITYTVHWT